MKKLFNLCAVATCVLTFFAASAYAGTYSTDFEQYMVDNQAKDMVGAIITLADQVDLSALQTNLYAIHADRTQWHEAIVLALQEKASNTQGPIIAHLDALSGQGLVGSYQGLWIGNIILVTASAEALDILVQRDDVLQICPNHQLESIKPIEGNDDEPLIASVEIGLEKIHAPEVWAMGITGEGRLVSHLDTGVDGNHPALSSRWRGNDPRYADNPEWAWFDPVTNTSFPFDSGQHGTHTMGTICGLGQSTGDTIGVAFGAQWMCAGVIDRVSIPQTVEDALLSFQWLVDPDGNPGTAWDVPDVCSNSWGVTTGHGYPPCDQTFWVALDGLEAAGVVVVFAAGNEGPSANSLRRPADRATTDFSSFSVGALDGNSGSLPIADFSSRGPSYCTPSGDAAIKPEVSAPGVNVRSSIPGGSYQGGWSGTSMACPHVAGVVALMRQANPNLTSDQVKQIMFETADDLGTVGEDNNYGAGIVNAYEAVMRALAYLEGWGTLAGQITDQASGTPLQGALVSVVDRPWAATSRANGWYFLFMPADTLFNIRVDYPPTHLPIFDQQSVVENETTYVNYALEGKVTVTLKASFDNPDDIAYRSFYINGSWDNDGFYDDSWSGDLIEIKDDGEAPDDIEGDGVFTAEVLLARDTENTYSWALYTENYNINSAQLGNGADFDIPNLNPPNVPTFVVNPSGSDNSFVFSVEGDNGLSLDLMPGVNSRPFKWGASDSLYEGITYTFEFYTMHSDMVTYGSGGVGGPALHFTPEIDGAYDFIFNDYDDSYIVQLAGTEGPPAYLGAQSGLDGHIPVGWLPPGTVESTELAYDDGYMENAYYYYASTNLMANLFVPESFPVSIDSVKVHVLTEGDPYWPWPDPTHDPIGISIYLDNGTGMPETDPVFYTEATAEYGQWIAVDVDEIVVSSGGFWVAVNNLSDSGPYDGLGIDLATDYPANKWARLNGTWSTQDDFTGDHMIRAKVFGGGALTWLGYDEAIPAGEISPAVGVIKSACLANGTTRPVNDNGNNPNGSLIYHPRILSDPPLITDTEVLAGYNLYRDISPAPFDRDLKINTDLISATSYDDWGADPYGPIVNGVTYYYQASAVYDIGGSVFIEVGPSNEVTGTAMNHPPDRPYTLEAEAVGNDVNLTWDFGGAYDFHHFNIYRKLMPYGEWEVVGTSLNISYTDVIDEGNDGTYGYRVTAVDNGNPQLESVPSNSAYALVGHLPPGGLVAISRHDSEVPLRWMLPGTWSTGLDNKQDGTENPIITSHYRELNDGSTLDQSMKHAGEPVFPPVITDQGGPDEYGYTWIDSDEPGGPIYEWRDITDIGEQIPMSNDDQNLGPFELGFEFSFYGEMYSTFNICSNGWISFTSTDAFYWNQGIPSMDAPMNLVAPFWDDLYPPNGGQYWYYSDGAECVISFIDVPHISGGGPYTFQVIIRSTGTIMFEYGNIGQPVNSTTIGIQNADASIGLQVVFDAEYLHSDMAIRIGTGPEGIAPAHFNLYRSLTSPVPIDTGHLITRNIDGELTNYIDTYNIVNGTTYYYKMTSTWLDSVESPGSNEASGTPLLGGHLAADPLSISADNSAGEIVVVPLTLSNDGGLPVMFDIATNSEMIQFADEPRPETPAYTHVIDNYDKSNLPSDPEYPPVITDQGGPDEFGYVWIDSDEPNGPHYNWVDISGIGIPLYMYDDENQGPFGMEFGFPFYDQIFWDFRVCSNGWISFTSSYTQYSNYSLPNPNAPENLIAPFWDDLNPGMGGTIYYYTSAESTIVSWVDVPHYSSGGPYSFQIILTSNGVITLQYQYMIEPTNSATIGIQNGDMTIGLQVAFDQYYVHDELAVRMNAGWLSTDPRAGVVEAGDDYTVDVIMDASLLSDGTHEGTLTINSHDENNELPVITIPVTFIVDHVGIEDGITLLPREFALDQNYPNPFNARTEIRYALPVDSDVQLEIYNILGQKVTTLADGKQKAGYHSLIWNGTTTSGDIAATGMYLYKLSTNEKTFVKKMLMLK